MKKWWIVGAVLLVSQASFLVARRAPSPMAILKKRQLAEWKTLKAREKNEKQMMKRDHLPKPTRTMLKREMAIEERNLLARQQVERERLKHNQKLQKRTEKQLRAGQQ